MRDKCRRCKHAANWQQTFESEPLDSLRRGGSFLLATSLGVPLSHPTPVPPPAITQAASDRRQTAGTARRRRTPFLDAYTMFSTVPTE